jgi:hypothetical protein
VKFPASVASVEYSAFSSCISLKEIEFNASTNVNSYAFEKADRISNIYINSKDAPSLKEDVFARDVCENAVVHIPAGCKENVANVPGWKEFKHFEEFGITDVRGAVSDDFKVYGYGEKLFIKNVGDNAEVTIYTIGGNEVYSNTIHDEAVISLPSALYVVKVNGRTVKVSL